uniref:Uncharacterized protein n=1 Tax=Chromera velia CCMP2878 TaxID=1169474 RepID=A0A0G4HW50_9ALVE|eukprot:Cvel_8988.t1-p1 / transcript=Cvel_8988.t1 / gene=Cvel_8988 / organism=Chromera_velia_CCMP2878 / gene_product=hypothetical protein / transcript_product=hypothetical protein / location=Cvel_scaffold507:58012-59496(-) / protein_length=495 / sequence_SO=supercontig / SO=protein_coding / is_pseudo=false
MQRGVSAFFTHGKKEEKSSASSSTFSKSEEDTKHAHQIESLDTFEYQAAPVERGVKKMKTEEAETASKSEMLSTPEASTKMPKDFPHTPDTLASTPKPSVPSSSSSASASGKKPSGSNAAAAWAKLLDRSGPTRGSASERIEQEKKALVKAVIKAGFGKRAKLVRYATSKARHAARPAPPKNFGPKALSQWHWFFCATRKFAAPAAEQEASKGGATFSLHLDKWQLAQGECQQLDSMGGRKRSATEKEKESEKQLFSYGCAGAKGESTAAKRKRELLLASIQDDQKKREERSKRADSHFASVGSGGGNVMGGGGGRLQFTGDDGNPVWYSGMPIGGSHDWDYADADMVEHQVTEKGGEGEKVVLQARDVRWKEKKTDVHRWEIDVMGQLQGPGKTPKETIQQPGPWSPPREGVEEVLIGDQIATKLTPSSYHVDFCGVAIELSKPPAVEKGEGGKGKVQEEENDEKEKEEQWRQEERQRIVRKIAEALVEVVQGK